MAFIFEKNFQISCFYIKTLFLAMPNTSKKSRHMLSADNFEKKMYQRKSNQTKSDALDARLNQIKKWMDQGEIF